MNDEFDVIETRNGKPCLIRNGYTYRIKKHNLGVTTWICTKERNSDCRCRGSIKTREDEILKETEHACVPSEAETDVKKALFICKKRAREDVNVPVHQIYKQEMQNIYDRGFAHAAKILPYASVKSALNSIRRESLGINKQPEPANSPETGFPDTEDLYQLSDDENNAIVETNSTKMNFSNKVVLITGASSGIGKATAILMAKFGAKLSLCGRNQENLENVAKICEDVSEIQPLIVQADLRDDADIQKIIRETIDHYACLDVLVNNAGILEMGTIETTTLHQFDRIFDVNVRAVYRLTSLAVPYLIKNKGNIVNVSSVNGLRSFPGVLAYNMSKSALDQFTKCTALELASKGVRVNSVNPGVIKTELQKTGGMDEKQYAKFLKKSEQTHALGRPGEPEEVAKVIAFLASEDSSFMTGATLPVDGGRHAMCPR